MQATLKILKGEYGVNKTYWLHRKEPKGLVVFFGGDRVTDTRTSQIVQTLQDPKQQAIILYDKFEDCSVVVVLPSREEAGFVCFDHFLNACTPTGEPLPSSWSGYPNSFATYKAFSQLQSLLQNSGGNVLGLPWSLIGFSKGGTVVNQALCELSCWSTFRQRQIEGQVEAHGMPSTEVQSVMQSLHTVHFLDVGLNMSPAYIIRDDIIKPLGWFAQHQKLRVALHGTPYQWSDIRRAHQLLHVQRFQHLLQDAGVPCTRRTYFAKQSPALELHFEILPNMVAE